MLGRKKITHVEDVIQGRSRILEIQRLTPDQNTENYANLFFNALEKDEAGENEFLEIITAAVINGKLIHFADVVYRTKKHQDLFMSDPQALIERHKIFIDSCRELREESNELLLTFIFDYTQKLSANDRYKIWEGILTQAINAYEIEKNQHPMQMIIDHMYHCLCGHSLKETPRSVDLNKKVADILVEDAREMREQTARRSFLKCSMWSKNSDEKSALSDVLSLKKCNLF